LTDVAVRDFDQVADAFLELIAAHGSDKAFVNPGTDTYPLQEAWARRKERGLEQPEAVLCTHEFTAVSAAHDTVSGPADTARSIPDATLLEPAMAQAMADRSVSRVIIEYRGYYRAAYSVEGGDGRRRAAVIGAGQGVVYGEAPPGRRQTLRDQAVFLGVAVLLIAEAAFAPGLYPRLIAVLVTAFIAFLVLAGTVVTDG